VNRICLPEDRELCEHLIKGSDSIKYGIFLASCVVSSCQLVKYSAELDERYDCVLRVVG
jgi:hypothetical protein